MQTEMPDENDTSQKRKPGVLASALASVGALSLSGELGQREKTWKLWKDRLVRANRWMAVNDDKLDLLLLVVGEELQNLLQTLPEQPTDCKSHIEMLDHAQHFKSNRNNTLEMCKCLNTEWSPDM